MEKIEEKMKRIDMLISTIDLDGPESFEIMRTVAKELVELLKLNFKIIVSAQKILSF